MIRHQSYTATNFCKIFYRENRKRNFLEANFEIFKPLRKYTKLIQSINNKFNQKQYTNEQKKYKANLLKDKLKQKKYETLFVILHEIEKNILDRKYDLSLVQGTINKKTVYKLDSTDPTIYFLLKQLQYNLRQAFNISMSDRHSIVSQVISLVADNFPKILIKADISQFYESVPHEKLLKKILNNVNLNIESKQIINSLLDSYKSVSGQAVGIPRGIGISAFLSELYMQDIDEQIKNFPDLTYFARYVDDIVMIFTPSAQIETPEERYFNEFNNIITKNELALNGDKTKKISLNDAIDIDFLGYTISNNNQKLKVELSKKKFDRYKNKIDKAIDDYLQVATNKHREKQARKLLINRIRYLTGNFKLYGAKRNVISGIHFSSKLITDNSRLKALDRCFHSLINKSNIVDNLKQRLTKYSFADGFDKKRFYNFNKSTMQDIQKIWRNI